jgi:polar amino acid transport system substrate-binding protein
MTETRDAPHVANPGEASVLRLGLFPSFFYRKAPDGALDGVAIEIGRALAARTGAALEPREYPDPPDAVRALRAGACDVAFLGIDPARAGEVDFSPGFIRADFSFLVPAASAVRAIADADGLRIAIVRRHLMDTAFRGQLMRAERVYADTPDGAFALFRGGQADLLAGIRPGLIKYAAQWPGTRVLADRYGANVMALAVAKGDPRLAIVRDFVETAVASGLVRDAIANAGLDGIDVIRAGSAG